MSFCGFSKSILIFIYWSSCIVSFSLSERIADLGSRLWTMILIRESRLLERVDLSSFNTPLAGVHLYTSVTLLPKCYVIK